MTILMKGVFVLFFILIYKFYAKNGVYKTINIW